MPISYFNFFNLFQETLDINHVCISFLKLPIHTLTVKWDGSNFQRYCNIVASKGCIKSDTVFTQNQCTYYQNEINLETNLSNTHIDSSFFLRDIRSERCCSFIAELPCTWLHEIHCFSDRHQLSFPISPNSNQIHGIHSHSMHNSGSTSLFILEK